MAESELDDIIRENTPRLRSFVRSKMKNSDDADDIVQDTFYQFLRTISIMDNPIGQVTSWLYTVAHNLIVNHGKRVERRVESGEIDFMHDISEIMMASANEAPDIRMLRTLVWEELDKALSELPREQREAVEMTEIEGLSVKEAAARMGVPMGTFLSRKHYAVVFIRRRLRTLYEEITENRY